MLNEILEESEMIQLQQLTEDYEPKLLWYGRYNFWREGFEAKINDISREILFTHYQNSVCDFVTDKLARIFLTQVQAIGVDLTGKRIILESYLDRNIVNLENAAKSGMFWHLDSITVDGQKKIADFTLILVINGKVKAWEGADIILQLGGYYAKEESYEWINSDFPEIIFHPTYNKALIFKNSNTGQMVTPLIPLANSCVHRDVFIVTCYFI